VEAHRTMYTAVADQRISGYDNPTDILLHTPAQIKVLLS